MLTPFAPIIESFRTRRTQSLRIHHPDVYNYVVCTTAFLSPNVSATQRLWHFWNDTWSIPKCHCGKEVHWDIVKQTYRQYCGKSCVIAKPAATHPCPVCSSPVYGVHDTCSVLCRNTLVRSATCTDEQLNQALQMIPTLETTALISWVANNPGPTNRIRQLTSHLSVNKQVRHRALYLLGQVKAQPHRKEFDPQALLDTLERKTCLMCDAPRRYTKRRFSKYCSDTCKQAHTLESAERRRPKGIKPPPSNKNTDVRLNDKAWLEHAHHVLETPIGTLKIKSMMSSRVCLM